MTPQPGTAGTGDDPLAQLVTQELTVNGQTVTRLVGLAFDSADQTDGVLRFDGTGSTNGITDGSAKVLVNGTVYDIAGAEWVDLSGTRHTVDSWEKVINSQFDVTITGTNGPVAPGNTLDVTADVTNSGTDQDTQTVTLDINNSVGQVDSTSVTLTGGGSTTQTLSWAVPSGQTKQEYQATVASADDSASQTVTVGATGPTSVIDQFEDGNISEYGGGTGEFVVNTNSPVFQGGASLKADGTVNNNSVVSAPGEGLQNYPTRTDWIRGFIYITNSGSAGGILFYGEAGRAWNGTWEGYNAEVNAPNNLFRILREDSGSFATVDSANQTVSTGQWYQVDIKSDNTTIEATFTDLSDGSTVNLSGDDSTYSGSRFGLKKRKNARYDDIRMKAGYGLGGNSGWSLTKHTVDSGLSDPDGIGLTDITASGAQDMVVGNGTGGQVWLYEQGGDPDTWTQHTVGTGFDEVEGVGVGDVDGDGNYEIGVCDQKVGEFHLAVSDTADPTGTWSTVLLDSGAEYIQTVRFFDIDGDGNPEPVYAFQGNPSTDTGNYGVRWQEFGGGDPLNSANWTQHEIINVGGAYWIPYQMADMSGDGTANDLVVTCRYNGAQYDGGIRVLENPGDPTNAWTTRSYDVGTQHLICSYTDLTGDGTATDLVSHESPNSASGRVWLSEYDGSNYTTSQFTNSNDAYNNAFSHNWSSSAVWDLFLFNDTGGRQELWIHDGTDWQLAGSATSAKAQDDVYTHDFDGDGTADVATVGVNSGEVFWLEVNQQ